MNTLVITLILAAGLAHAEPNSTSFQETAPAVTGYQHQSTGNSQSRNFVRDAGPKGEQAAAPFIYDGDGSPTEVRAESIFGDDNGMADPGLSEVPRATPPTILR